MARGGRPHQDGRRRHRLFRQARLEHKGEAALAAPPWQAFSRFFPYSCLQLRVLMGYYIAGVVAGAVAGSQPPTLRARFLFASNQ